MIYHRFCCKSSIVWRCWISNPFKTLDNSQPGDSSGRFFRLLRSLFAKELARYYLHM